MDGPAVDDDKLMEEISVMQREGKKAEIQALYYLSSGMTGFASLILKELRRRTQMLPSGS